MRAEVAGVALQRTPKLGHRYVRFAFTPQQSDNEINELARLGMIRFLLASVSNAPPASAVVR